MHLGVEDGTVLLHVNMQICKSAHPVESEDSGFESLAGLQGFSGATTIPTWDVVSLETVIEVSCGLA